MARTKMLTTNTKTDKRRHTETHKHTDRQTDRQCTYGGDAEWYVVFTRWTDELSLSQHNTAVRTWSGGLIKLRFVRFPTNNNSNSSYQVLIGMVWVVLGRPCWGKWRTLQSLQSKTWFIKCWFLCPKCCKAHLRAPLISQTPVTVAMKQAC